jgi:oligopeptide transport system substrate-binding protein
MRKLGWVMAVVAASAMYANVVGQEVRVKSGGQEVKVKTKQTMKTGTIRVTVNGDAVVFADSAPRMVNRRVLVPLRGVFEKLGAYVEWHPEEQMVIATKGDKKVEVWIGKELAEIDDDQTKLDTPPILVTGRTYVPLRFVSEALGAEVTWHEPTTTVIIRVGG